MSVGALTAAFTHSQAKGAARLVLLSMADEANGDGLLTAYRRSQGWLARKANIDARTCRRAIAELVELGEVEVLAIGDGRASSDYRLLLPGLQDEGGQDAPSGGAGSTPRGGKVDPQGGQDAPPIIPLFPVDSPVDPKPLARDLDAARHRSAFDTFWRAYPNRTAKGAALKAWPAATGKAPPTQIVAGAERYRDDPNRDPQFTKHPATWLRAECWADPPLPQRRNGHRHDPDAGFITDRDGVNGEELVL